MTRTMDPPRLFESLDAPLELRRLLQHAQEDRLSEAQSAHLLRFLDNRACAQGPAAGVSDCARDLSRPTRLAIKERRARKAIAAVMVSGVGLIGTLAAAQYYQGAKESHSARSFVHWRESVPAVVASGSVAVTGVPAAPSHITLGTPGVTSRRSAEPTTTRGSARPVASTSSDPASSSSAIDASEYQLLRAAREALAQDPARASALANQHAQQFPTGMLSQEREAIAVDALMRLGSAGQAKARGERFLRLYPQSPYTKRIETAIGHGAGTETTP